ncbi:MAG: UDP-N-acetylmuramoyl-L-alanyl-D-glutamate--2,6-diaminopimelate ligase [Puniceicoccales bacterium]|jgi:UDP-N-acetylmuramoyl-L-alanyl-D-glutamate--2,6-diaminopimelate ligase|nr:UDP-N-acetylmuramoyl-L-alanyl-D-glutamate--2,6-diaminopimelate ligase [Puniceicoccales bacterium]
MTWQDLFPEAPNLFPSGSSVALLADHDGQLAAIPPGESGLRIFFAIRGVFRDGHDFLERAISSGANAAVVEENCIGRTPEHFPLLRVENVRRFWAEVQRRRSGYPDRELAIHAVTGTDGKTTTIHALQHLLGENCARMDTIDCQSGFGVAAESSAATTHGAAVTYPFLRRAVDGGCVHAALEMSSHALATDRLWGLRISTAIFTNLSREHLDFHGTCESYFDAKCRLFDGRCGCLPNFCAINGDDSFGRHLLGQLRGEGRRVLSFGSGDGCEWQLLESVPEGKGTRFHFRTPEGNFWVHSSLLGKCNGLNLLAATAAASPYFPIPVLLERLKTFSPPRGRLEPIPLAGGATAFVDYAHTPGALAAVLGSLREHFPRRRIGLVFGCGGNRDRSKRPAMGKVAEALTDWTILTADNPRDEDPMAICEEICAGFSGRRPPVIPDRFGAIAAGVSRAVEGREVLLVAGKGHERTQEISGKFFPFCDGDVLLEMAESRRKGENG